jgi:YTH domain-containing family protein
VLVCYFSTDSAKCFHIKGDSKPIVVKKIRKAKGFVHFSVMLLQHWQLYTLICYLSWSHLQIHYIPGTSMLKIFKCARADGCLLDEFMMHEEEEARSSQCRRSKLRQAAPQFMPASMHARPSYNTQLPKSSQLMHASMYDHHTYDILFPKFPQFMPNTLLPPRSDSVVMNRIISETNELTGKLQGLNLDRHQSSWQEFGILTSIASTANTQSYAIQTHENVVKAMTYYQAYSPLSSNVKPASGGEQQCLKVEIAPTERPQPETAASLSFKAPEKYPSEGKNDSLQSASEVPEIIAGEQKTIGKPCSVTTNSLSSETCSKPRVVTVAIGSMLIPVTISN